VFAHELDCLAVNGEHVEAIETGWQRIGGGGEEQ